MKSSDQTSVGNRPWNGLICVSRRVALSYIGVVLSSVHSHCYVLRMRVSHRWLVLSVAVSYRKRVTTQQSDVKCSVC